MQLQLLFSVTVWVRRIKYFLSSWLIKKNDIWPFREGPFFMLGLPIQKMELEKIVVKGTEYLSPNKFYGHTKHSSNAKYTSVYILWILYCRSDSLIIHKFRLVFSLHFNIIWDICPINWQLIINNSSMWYAKFIDQFKFVILWLLLFLSQILENIITYRHRFTVKTLWICRKEGFIMRR